MWFGDTKEGGVGLRKPFTYGGESERLLLFLYVDIQR